MAEQEKRAVERQAAGGGAGQRAEQGALGQPVDEVPENVRAEQDMEDRKVGPEPLARPGLAAEVPDDILAERDLEARTAEEGVERRWTGD
jgi:hypothetical protein